MQLVHLIFDIFTATENSIKKSPPILNHAKSI